MRRAGFRGAKVVMAAPRRRSLLTVLIGTTLVALVAVPRNANAACLVTISGTVNCSTDTTTTDTTNLNGTESISSDRKQLFNNGAAINGTVQSGVTIGGFGLRLSEEAAAPRPINIQNQGLVTTAQAVNALQFLGNGGSISYSGDGGATNTTGAAAGLFVDNTSGNVSIATGKGAISGATGIDASTTDGGDVTITTGSGLVSGTRGQGIFASTKNGALSVTVQGGGATNTGATGAAIFVDSVRGNVSTTTGAGAISGPTGINASTLGSSTVTIATGSGLVTGTNGPAIYTNTENGALNVTIGSGGVTSAAGHYPAIVLSAKNGNMSVTANGNVSANGSSAITHDIDGIAATSRGRGNITIGGPGTISAQGGRAIFAIENDVGLGGILVTGTGDTISGTATEGCCSAIRAQIQNPADPNNIIINRSGNVSLVSTTTQPVAAIHPLTVGTGNIIVTDGAGATITDRNLYGINASAFGRASSGSISVSTGALSTINAGGAGIYAVNSAFAIPGTAGSTIAVTNNGTINSGAAPNPVGRYGGEGGAGPTTMPAGILAGYTGGSVFGSASGPYTSCGAFGCTTVTPNPNVSGTVSVVNNAAINATGGDGIFAFNFGNGNVSVTASAPINVTGAASQNGIEAFSAEVGNISVTTVGNITAVSGNGIQTNSAGTGTTSINVMAGTIQGATSGITTKSISGAVQINNSATIQNISGQPGDLAVTTSGAGNATLTNNTRAVVTGTVSMLGTGTNNFTNAGAWNTLGTSSFAGSSSINNSGTINVPGLAKFSGLTALSNSGTLNLAVGGAIGTLTIAGDLAFQSGALYLVRVNPTTASFTNVSGTAALAGSVNAQFAAGSYVSKQYTILTANGGLGGTSFAGLTNTNLPSGTSDSLSYDPDHVYLNLRPGFTQYTGLAINEQNVANALSNYFNTTGGIPSAFFSLTPNGLMQVDGEVAVDSEFAAFELMDEFLQLMLDPFVDGRLGSGAGIGGGGGGQAMSFAPDQQAFLPSDIALAYAGVLKAAAPPPFVQRWTAWGASYGGGEWTNGNAAVGSSNVTAQTFGFAAGMDYHYSPDTIFGFALGGGGTNWGLNMGGTGRSDAFQTGVYGITRSGPAYLAAALAFANHWMTTNRAALGDELTASFDAQSYGGRVEAGYRYAVLPRLGFGVTPYAALQAQDFHTPSYSETDLTGGGFGLSYAAMNATDTRTELGARFDDPAVVGGIPLLLRGRVAWAHDFVSNPSLSAVFESLPGSNFVVNGAPMPHDSALTSAGAELFITPRWTFLVKFDGEFAPGSQTYAGSGTLRYSW